MKEYKEEFTVDFTDRKSEIILDFVLGKVTLSDAICKYRRVNAEDMGLEEDQLRYTIDVYENIFAIPYYDRNEHDVLNDFSDRLNTIGYYFIGCQNGLKEAIKAYNSSSSDSQINVVVENMLSNIFRVKLPNNITDGDYKKLCDSQFIKNKLTTLSKL